MNFFDYLWSLLNRPLKKGTENKNWLTTLGEEFDEVKQSIFKLRRAWLIKSALGKSLNLLGEARGLPRYKNEVDDLYRERLLAAFDTYVFGGTYPAMEKTLAILGYLDSEIELLYKVDPQRWAEFNIFLDQERLNELNNLDVVKKEVSRIKQASALPNYILTYYQTFRIRGRPIIGKSTIRPACGTIKSNFLKSYKNLGFLVDSNLNLAKVIESQLSTLKISSKKTKTIQIAFIKTSNLNLAKVIESQLSTLKVSSKKTKTTQKGFTELSNLNLAKTNESQLNVLKVSSKKTKTTQKGFIEAGNINMESVKEEFYNQLPVCSKNFKVRRVV